MKRLGIFVFYDEDGIVDRYVQYYLEQMSFVLDRIVIVSNSAITENGKNILQKYSEDIRIRKNMGFDGGAYKDIIVDYLGKEVYQTYDQIVLFNDTVYGPVYDIKKIFAEMDEIDGLDMWGITEQSAHARCHEYVIPPHIQAYFLVFNKKLIMSDDFWEYWSKLQYPQNYDEAVMYFEGGISDFLRKKGYRLSAYCKPERLEREKELQPVNSTILYCEEIMEYFGCPFLKRKALVEKMGDNVNAISSMLYVKELGYDTAFIWENLLRKYSILDILETMNLHYIVDDRLADNITKTRRKVAVIYVSENEDYLQKVIQKIQKINSVDWFVVSENKGINAPGVQFVQRNKEKLFESYFILCSDVWKTYDYVCCINDAQWEKDMLPLECYIRNDMLWNNLIGLQEYINSVVRLFETEDSLGILLPYFPSELGNNDDKICYFDETTLNEIDNYAKLFGLTLKKEINKTPLLGQRSFWCRTSTIANLLREKDFEKFCGENETFIRDLLPYLFVANSQYPAYLNNSVYAGKQNIHTLLTTISTNNRKEAEERALFDKMKQKDIYIYGAGRVADALFQKCKMKGKNVKGFIVSDGQEKEQKKYELPVVYLSRVELGSNDLVVVGVGSKLRPEIEKKLTEKSIKYI